MDRETCVVDPQRPDNCTPILRCDAPAVLNCTARGCTCEIPPPQIKQCTFVLVYPADQPQNVIVGSPDPSCPGLEFALAAVLAKLLAN